MQLTDNDIRDINRYLQDGKPLPDKYRFLLFGDAREVELVWNGKTNEVCNVALPFQAIEQIDEPREEKVAKLQTELFDSSGSQISDWTNKLIWGDNKYILSSLKNGPLRKEIEDNGGIKLIYIDPPFDVGADFSMDIEIGDEQFTKEPTVLEEIAYRDTWGKGADSFIQMLYERLSIMHDLLAEDSSIYVHCDWRVNSFVRLILDQIFGGNNLVNQITWKRTFAHGDSGQGAKHMGRISDTIFLYSKSENFMLNDVFTPYDPDYITKVFNQQDADGRKWQSVSLTAPGGAAKGNPIFEFMGVRRFWQYSKENLEKLSSENKIYQSKPGTVPRKKMYLDESKGIPLQDIWSDIVAVQGQANENVDYPTQKPEALLERIIRASSNDGDIVADFFCGSGTTLAVAEKLGRKWIGADLGKFAIHTGRKRLIEVQRQLKKECKNYRAFEILNLGKYERQQFAQKEDQFVQLVLRAYRAQPETGFRTFHGKKVARMVVVGPMEAPVTRTLVEGVLKECQEKQITKVDILGFEFEMGLLPEVIDEAKDKGIDLSFKYIPREVFDKRAVDANEVVFYDVSFVEVKPLVKKHSVAIELTDFSVYYNQDVVANIETNLQNGSSKVTVENGQIVKISKDKAGFITKDILTKKWTDWIDYWAVDFDFESRKEIIRVRKDEPEQIKMDGAADPKQMKFDNYEEVWTGSYIFENEWQSFRTKKNRTLELTSVSKECTPGRRKIAIKIVDIFGNDTTKVIEITV